MTELPYSIQIIQALGPTIVTIVVGAIAAYVAFRQWRTANDRLRLDLFEKRYVIYQKFQDVLVTTLSEGKISYDQILAFYRATRGIEFLFGPEVEQYLGELRDRLGKLGFFQEQITRGPINNSEYNNHVQEAYKIKLYVEKQLMEVMRTRFEPYLSFSHLK